MYSYQPDTPQIPQINPVTGQLEPPPIDKEKEKAHFEEFYEVQRPPPQIRLFSQASLRNKCLHLLF